MFSRDMGDVEKVSVMGIRPCDKHKRSRSFACIIPELSPIQVRYWIHGWFPETFLGAETVIAINHAFDHIHIVLGLGFFGVFQS